MTCCAQRSMKWHDCLCHTQLSNGLQHYRKRLGSSDIGFGHVPMGRFTYQGLLEDYTGVYTPSGRVLSALQTDHRDRVLPPTSPIQALYQVWGFLGIITNCAVCPWHQLHQSHVENIFKYNFFLTLVAVERTKSCCYASMPGQTIVIFPIVICIYTIFG